MATSTILTASESPCKMLMTSANTEGMWFKVCHVSAQHYQGQFVRILMLVGNGNNGQINQNTMIDLIMQHGWTGSNGGIFGCNYIYYPLSTGKTSIRVKVIATSGNTDYDVWVKSNAAYTKITYIPYFDRTLCSITDTSGVSQAAEPSGTACSIQGGTVSYTTF